MKSDSYKKTRGEGSLDTTRSSNIKSSASELCKHISPAGRRCHMLSVNGSGLCTLHFRRSQAVPDSEAVAAELLGSVEDFSSAAQVNLFLGNLVKQMARKRIARRDAIALAYISQLLLNSLSAMNLEQQRRKDSRPLRIIWDMPHPASEDMPAVTAANASDQEL
jgi:hypothetical protein